MLENKPGMILKIDQIDKLNMKKYFIILAVLSVLVLGGLTQLLIYFQKVTLTRYDFLTLLDRQNTDLTGSVARIKNSLTDVFLFKAGLGTNNFDKETVMRVFRIKVKDAAEKINNSSRSIIDKILENEDANYEKIYLKDTMVDMNYTNTDRKNVTLKEGLN